VPAPLRRVDPALPRARARGRGPRGDPGAGRRRPRSLGLRHARLGAALAVGGDLAGAQGRRVTSPVAPLLLASVSPQRRAILGQLGLPFDVVGPRYDESPIDGLSPVELVRSHARGKAESVAD